VTQGPIQPTASERAQWLSDLAEALEQAQRLTWRIGLLEGTSVEAMELYGRLEAARTEVQSLRLGRFGSARLADGPDWTILVPWKRDPRSDPN